MCNKSFPSKGLTYFWFLNDYCDDNVIDSQIESFVENGFKTICIHPRDGLMLPYGGSDWFDFVTKTVHKLKANGLEIWLYDEFPYPSGNGAGRIVIEHPEFRAKHIVMHTFKKEDTLDDRLWFIPTDGELLFCGTVGMQGEVIHDYTANVGMVFRTWNHLKDWDSRWYYPTTPLYICDRAMANKQEYALKLDDIKNSEELVAFTAVEVPCSKRGFHVDTLNIKATEEFIRSTYDRYFDEVGEMFGKEISAIFSDEVSYKGITPYCKNMFSEFEKIYHYNLRERLSDLFTEQEYSRALQTKLDYREYLGAKLRKNWFKPVNKWCKKHNLAFVGHVSPEDDIAEQARNVSNLMPIQKEFTLGGLDLIIPAVGDANNSIINIGVIGAVSVAQQTKKNGVMCEMLACSGYNFPPEMACKIIQWQTVMGVTTPVIHGAFLTTRDDRKNECPPDFGPWTKFGDDLSCLNKSIQDIQQIMIGAKQIAPVAILWPIKSYQINCTQWQAEDNGIRKELNTLVLKCLENQVGIQFLDEEVFHKAKMKRGKLSIGHASYSQIIIPASHIWSEKTWKLLAKYQNSGLEVFQHGTKPRYLRANSTINTIETVDFQQLKIENLPKNIDVISDDNKNIRVTAWQKDGKVFHLLYYIGDGCCPIKVGDKSFTLTSQSIVVY